jgi:hypothetical protein
MRVDLSIVEVPIKTPDGNPHWVATDPVLPPGDTGGALLFPVHAWRHGPDAPWPGTGVAIMVCMSEHEHRSVGFPGKRRRTGPVVVGLVMAAGLLSGCSMFRDYSGDTCDGRKPVGSLEQAGRDLVVAAYAADRDGVCRVTHPFPGGELNDTMVAETRELLAERGITPQNLNVVVGEQLGSGVSVQLTDGSNNASHAIDVSGTSVRDDGYTIGLPPEVYPEVPEHPASQSASTGTSP